MEDFVENLGYSDAKRQLQGDKNKMRNIYGVYLFVLSGFQGFSFSKCRKHIMYNVNSLICG